jgi:hypothetical protein
MNDENSGCSEGWPSYAIDHVDPSGRASGLVNRVMEWASYLSRVDGELYSGERNGSRTTDTNAPLNWQRRPARSNFAAVGLNLNTPGAFWESARFYGGNGDDYMLYPGTPDRIGGRTGIPIESIRFKHLRDGYEDNEYLRLLEVGSSREAVLHWGLQILMHLLTYVQNWLRFTDISIHCMFGSDHDVLIQVLRYVTTFMHAAFSWDDDIGRFEALRVRIGRAIEGASSQGLGVWIHQASWSLRDTPFLSSDFTPQMTPVVPDVW